MAQNVCILGRLFARNNTSGHFDWYAKIGKGFMEVM